VVTGRTTNLCPANNLFLVCATRLLGVKGHVVVSYTILQMTKFVETRIPARFHHIPCKHREEVKNGQNDISSLNCPAGYGNPTADLNTDLETKHKTALFAPIQTFLAQKLGAKSGRNTLKSCHFF